MFGALSNTNKMLQVDCVNWVRAGTSVAMAVPTAVGKTLPLYVASLGTGQLGLVILPLLSLEQQMERDLSHLDIPYINLSNTKADDLGQQLAKNPQLIITNVEALADKDKREALRKSRVEIGHIGWYEAMVNWQICLPLDLCLQLRLCTVERASRTSGPTMGETCSATWPPPTQRPPGS